MNATGLWAVVCRPWLWSVAVRQAVRLAPNRWWCRAPFLPLPDRRYLGFRLETQYGNAVHNAEPHDLVTYLAWCRSYQRALRRKRARG
ncbi:MAG: hypothetical protein EBV02_01840 [Actinobacteria bacterium]|nr:hypothetical protein [Actinomycetota bacterium]